MLFTSLLKTLLRPFLLSSCPLPLTHQITGPVPLLALPQMVSSLVTSGPVTYTGYYVSYPFIRPSSQY